MVFGLNTSPLYRQIEQTFDAAELEIINSIPDNDRKIATQLMERNGKSPHSTDSKRIVDILKAAKIR